MKKLYVFPARNRTTLDFETLLFRRIDQRASDLFEKIKTEIDPQLDRSETETLAVFLLTLMHRSPAGIAAMRELSRVMFDDVRRGMRDRYDAIRTEHDPKTFEEYEAQAGPNEYLDHFSDIFRTVVFNERVAAFLARMHWKRINLIEPGRRLLLSDDPLIRTNGLAGQEGHVAFPVSPTIAVIGCNDSRYFDTIFSLTARQLIEAMNIQTVESARHFVVDVDESQLRFVANRFGSKPRPTLSEASLRDAADQEDVTPLNL